jgi:hypothetical protein
VEWDGEQHLTAFGKHLNDDKVCIERFGITISNKDKLQFYLKQMYASNHFDKKEMTEWENKPEIIKNDFNNAKTYFKGLVRDYKVYEQNSGSTAGKHNFESANQATKANCCNELCQYIARIAQAAFKQEEQAANIHDSTKASMDAMAAQIKAMSDQITQLTKAMANKENAPNGSSSGGGSGSSGGRGRDKRTSQIRRSAIHQATQHGQLLFIAQFPSSRQEPHKRHLHMETTQPQHDGNLEQQKRQ